jgi:hypothetical protein
VFLALKEILICKIPEAFLETWVHNSISLQIIYEQCEYKSIKIKSYFQKFSQNVGSMTLFPSVYYHQHQFLLDDGGYRIYFF